MGFDLGDILHEVRDVRKVAREATGAIKEGSKLVGTVKSADDLVREEDNRNRARAERAEASGNVGEIKRRQTGRAVQDERDFDNGVVREGRDTFITSTQGRRGAGKPQDLTEMLVVELALAHNDPARAAQHMQRAERIYAAMDSQQPGDNVELRGRVNKVIDDVPVRADFAQGTTYTSFAKLVEGVNKKLGYAEPEVEQTKANPGPGAANTTQNPEKKEQKLAETGVTTGGASVQKTSDVTTPPAPKTEANAAETSGKDASVTTPAASELSQKQLNQQAQVLLQRLGLSTGNKNDAAYKAAPNDVASTDKMDAIVGPKTKAALTSLGIDPEKPITAETLLAINEKIKEQSKQQAVAPKETPAPAQKQPTADLGAPVGELGSASGVAKVDTKAPVNEKQAKDNAIAGAVADSFNNTILKAGPEERDAAIQRFATNVKTAMGDQKEITIAEGGLEVKAGPQHLKLPAGTYPASMLATEISRQVSGGDQVFDMKVQAAVMQEMNTQAPAQQQASATTGLSQREGFDNGSKPEAKGPVFEAFGAMQDFSKLTVPNTANLNAPAPGLETIDFSKLKIDGVKFDQSVTTNGGPTQVNATQQNMAQKEAQGGITI